MSTSRDFQATGAGHPDIRLPAALLLIAVVWTFAAANGPIQWSDSGDFISLAAISDWFAPHFAATAHPLFHLVSVTTVRLTGVEGLVYLNGLLMLPVALLGFRLAKLLGASRATALFAAAAVLLPHSVFWISTKVEVYTLNLVLILWALWLGLKPANGAIPGRRLLCLGIVTGLAASVHQLTFIVLLPLYIHLLFRVRAKIALTLPGFLIGMFPCYPGLLNDLRHGLEPLQIARAFLTGGTPDFDGWGGDLFRFDRMLAGKTYVAVTFLSISGVGALGLLLPRGGTPARILWGAAVFNLLFAVSYDVSDRFTFFLPGAVLTSILGIVALERFLDAHRWPQWLVAAAIVAPCIALCALALSARYLPFSLAQSGSAFSYRDDARYFLAPWLGDRSAPAFVADYERVATPGSSVLADWMPGGALRSAHVAGLFPDRHIEDCTEFEHKLPSADTRGMLLVRLNYCEYMQAKPLVPIAIGYRVDG